MIVTTPYDDSKYTALSRSLRTHRQSVHLTLRVAASLIGVSPVLLSAWEQGTETPDEAQQSAIRKAYMEFGKGGAHWRQWNRRCASSSRHEEGPLQ